MTGAGEGAERESHFRVPHTWKLATYTTGFYAPHDIVPIRVELICTRCGERAEYQPAMYAVRHLDVLDYFCRINPELVREQLAMVESGCVVSGDPDDSESVPLGPEVDV